MANKQPLLLVICDGWGIAPAGPGNAIELANTPNFDEYAKYYPKTALATSGPAVGLPKGVIGNSEVGHKNIGSGFILPQSMELIDREINSGLAMNNEIIKAACENAMTNKSAIHIVGLVSDGGAHSHISHLFFLLRYIKLTLYIERPVYIHVFTDGRDTAPKEALEFIKATEDKIAELKIDAKIASISGRYYAMDRNNNWDRIEKAYSAMVFGIGQVAPSATIAVEQSYVQGVTDEFILPTVISGEDKNPIGLIRDNDSVICFNFRPDRMIQLVRAFTDDNFDKFKAQPFYRLFFSTFVEYDLHLKAHVIFSEIAPEFPLAKVLSLHGLRQLHIAETEKYAHVTYFFNGGKVTPFPGEDRIIIPSPNVATFDLVPEMSAYEVTDRILESLEQGIYDFIVVNFANLDMVGHTGKVDATIKAAEAVDACLGKIVPKVLSLNGVVIVMADHGNADEVLNADGSINTEHSGNPVPFILINNQLKKSEPAEISLLDIAKSPVGTLADVMPTILDLLRVPTPETNEQWIMRGISLTGRLR